MLGHLEEPSVGAIHYLVLARARPGALGDGLTHTSHEQHHYAEEKRAKNAARSHFVQNGEQDGRHAPLAGNFWRFA